MSYVPSPETIAPGLTPAAGTLPPAATKNTPRSAAFLRVAKPPMGLLALPPMGAGRSTRPRGP
jgi:hypothetical protein